ncbi:MAG: YqeB family protein [Nocardioidaceae bacterium]
MPVGWLWLFRLGCPAVGFGLGFAIHPVVRWAVGTLSFAPGPLRLAAGIPTPWLVPILTAVGIGVGYWIAAEAERDSLTLTVDDDSLVAEHRGTERYIQRSQIASIFTDPKDLVVLDPDGREIFRGPATDLPSDILAATLRRHDYPWHGTHDPHEADYQRWIDGHPDLGHWTNALLRARRNALGSDNGIEADEIHAQLPDRGIVVRDRNKRQQYRRLPDESNDPGP